MSFLNICATLFFAGILNMVGKNQASIDDIKKYLDETYCQTISAEFSHIKVSLTKFLFLLIHLNCIYYVLCIKYYLFRICDLFHWNCIKAAKLSVSTFNFSLVFNFIRMKMKKTGLLQKWKRVEAGMWIQKTKQQLQ